MQFKMPSIRSVFIALVTFVFGGIFIAVVGNWFVELAKEHGFYESPSKRVHEMMGFLETITSSDYLPWLTGFGGAALALWADRLLRKLEGLRAAAFKKPPAPDQKPLTPDQRDFRKELMRFCSVYPEALQAHLNKVFEMVKDRERELNKGSPGSVAINFLSRYDMAQNMKGLVHLMHLKDDTIEKINVECTEREIRKFLFDYLWRQKAIGTINEIANIDLSSREEVKAWLALDAEARSKCREMAHWPEADTLKHNHDDKWASTGGAWKKQDREGYRE